MRHEFTEHSRINGVPKYAAYAFRGKRHKIALLIPVINEGARIISQLKAIENLNQEVDVILADGGSTDESRDYFFRGNHALTTLLVTNEGGGLSAQLRMGFHHCILSGYEGVITMDGNNKDGVSGIIGMLSALGSGADFVQGSRFIKGGKAVNTPFLRYLAIRLIHAPLISIAARCKFTDTTNGFRGHSVELIRKADLFQDKFVGYKLMTHIPLVAGQQNLAILEIPVERSYPVGVKIPTKITGFSANFSLVLDLISDVSRHLIKPKKR